MLRRWFTRSVLTRAANSRIPGSLFSVEPANLVMSALKKAEDRNSVVMRLFNPTDATIKGKVSLALPFKKAYLTNMNEDRQKEIKAEKNAVNLSVDKGKIVRLSLS